MPGSDQYGQAVQSGSPSGFTEFDGALYFLQQMQMGRNYGRPMVLLMELQ